MSLNPCLTSLLWSALLCISLGDLLVDSSVLSPAGFNHVCIICSNQTFSSLFSFLFPPFFQRLQVLAHKRSLSEFRWMVIIADNVNILLFPVGLGAIFLCCGVCHGIKLSNWGAGMKVMSSSGYPASDIISRLVPQHASAKIRKQALQQQHYKCTEHITYSFRDFY